MLEPVFPWIGHARLRACIDRPAAIGAVLLALLLPSGTTFAEGLGQPTRPFTIGERLTYEVSWLNLTAAIAVLEVVPREGATGGVLSAAKLIGTAQSTSLITKFFPVDNRVESDLDMDTLTPEHMTFRRREGKKKEDIEYTFRQKEGTVTAVRGGTTESLPIPVGTHDIISCLYYTRAVLPPKLGASLMMNVYHDKKTGRLRFGSKGSRTSKGAGETWKPYEYA